MASKKPSTKKATTKRANKRLTASENAPIIRPFALRELQRSEADIEASRPKQVTGYERTSTKTEKRTIPDPWPWITLWIQEAWDDYVEAKKSGKSKTIKATRIELGRLVSDYVWLAADRNESAGFVAPMLKELYNTAYNLQSWDEVFGKPTFLGNKKNLDNDPDKYDAVNNAIASWRDSTNPSDYKTFVSDLAQKQKIGQKQIRQLIARFDEIRIGALGYLKEPYEYGSVEIPKIGSPPKGVEDLAQVVSINQGLESPVRLVSPSKQRAEKKATEKSKKVAKVRKKVTQKQ
jgi:hypothetical protein